MKSTGMKIWLIPGVLCGALVAGYAGARLPADRAEARAAFDRGVWTSERRIHDVPAPRLAMADAVLARLDPGMTRAAVTALLGPPTETPHFRGHDLVYWLGQGGRGFSVDSHWLLVDFGDPGLVSARVATD